MYVMPTHALANQLRAATYLMTDKILIDLLQDAAERLEDLEKIAEHYRLKAEDAAREIFEEIKKEIASALESNYKARKCRLESRGATDNFINLVDGKISALRGIYDFIDYLEQKHTGEGK